MFWGFKSGNSEITTSRRLSGSEGFGHYLMKKVFGHPKSVPGGVERQYFGYTPQVAWQGRTWLQGAPHSAEEESETGGLTQAAGYYEGQDTGQVSQISHL